MMLDKTDKYGVQIPLLQFVHIVCKLHTFPGAPLTQLNLIRWSMGPEVHVSQHKQPAVAVVLLAGDLCRLAGHSLRPKDMLLARVFLSPASRDRGDILLLKLALPLIVEICSQSFADSSQVMAAACRTCQNASGRVAYR